MLERLSYDDSRQKDVCKNVKVYQFIAYTYYLELFMDDQHLLLVGVVVYHVTIVASRHVWLKKF